MRWRCSSPKKAADAAAASVVAAGGRVVREGFLVKKGHVLRTQKERFFVLRQHSLSYFRARRSERSEGSSVADAGTLRGVLELAPTDIVTPAPHSELWFRVQKLPDASGKSYKIDLKGAIRGLL